MHVRFLLVVQSLCYPSSDLRHVFSSREIQNGKQTIQTQQQQQQKNHRTKFDSVDTVVFPSERTPASQHTSKMFVISFPLCQQMIIAEIKMAFLFFIFWNLCYPFAKETWEAQESNTVLCTDVIPCIVCDNIIAVWQMCVYVFFFSFAERLYHVDKS